MLCSCGASLRVLINVYVINIHYLIVRTTKYTNIMCIKCCAISRRFEVTLNSYPARLVSTGAVADGVAKEVTIWKSIVTDDIVINQ